MVLAHIEVSLCAIFWVARRTGGGNDQVRIEARERLYPGICRGVQYRAAQSPASLVSRLSARIPRCLDACTNASLYYIFHCSLSQSQLAPHPDCLVDTQQAWTTGDTVHDRFLHATLPPESAILPAIHAPWPIKIICTYSFTTSLTPLRRVSPPLSRMNCRRPRQHPIGDN